MPSERIENVIYLIRSEKVMLDHDLALLYGVTTGALVQAVKRNAERFPADFMFQLVDAEFTNSRSQIVISSWGGRHTAFYAFTEQGVAMLSGVLRGARAVAVNVEIVRKFVRLRRLLLSQEEMARKLFALERRYDSQFKVVFDAIRQIMAPETPPEKRRIGFHPVLPGYSTYGRFPAFIRSSIPRNSGNTMLPCGVPYRLCVSPGSSATLKSHGERPRSNSTYLWVLVRTAR